ncbi:hypothetical protein ACWJIK_09170 [Corynebacterium minutissimum]
MSLNFFRRGRGLASLVGLAALLIIGAIVISDTNVSKAFLVAAVVIGLIFAVMAISASKRSEGLTKEVLRRQTRLAAQVQQLSSAAMKQQRRTEREPLKSITSDLTKSPDEISVFAPSTIPASRIIGRPTAHTAGRLAADQTMDIDSTEILDALMRASADAWTRKIELIGSRRLEASLCRVADVKRIFAPHLLGKPPKDTSYLVIEENEFEHGAWSGLLSTQKTSSFLSLVEHITEAKENGTVVIVCPSDTSNHFTEDLRQRATVVLAKGPANWNWEADLHAPVFRALLPTHEKVCDEIKGSI